MGRSARMEAKTAESDKIPDSSRAPLICLHRATCQFRQAPHGGQMRFRRGSAEPRFVAEAGDEPRLTHHAVPCRARGVGRTNAYFMEGPLLIDLVVSPASSVELGQDVFPAGASFRIRSRLDHSGAYKWSLRGTSRVCPSTGDVTASGTDGLDIANSQKYVDASSQCDPRAGTASPAGRDSNGLPTPRLRQTGG